MKSYFFFNDWESVWQCDLRIHHSIGFPANLIRQFPTKTLFTKKLLSSWKWILTDWFSSFLTLANNWKGKKKMLDVACLKMSSFSISSKDDFFIKRRTRLSSLKIKREVKRLYNETFHIFFPPSPRQKDLKIDDAIRLNQQPAWEEQTVKLTNVKCVCLFIWKEKYWTPN